MYRKIMNFVKNMKSSKPLELIKKPLSILSKKDWLIYGAINLGIIIISLIFYIWMSSEVKLAEEDHRIDTQIIADNLVEKAVAERNQKEHQKIAEIQRKTNLDENMARKIVEEANLYETLSAELIVAVMFVESSYNPIAVSYAGAIGIMQVMPATGEWLADKLDKPYELEMLYDPIYNIELACFYLDFLITRYDNDLHTALTAYNRGMTGLERYREANQRTSSGYSTKVIELFETLKID